MANKIFNVPFAELGDRAEVPDAVQPSGEVSYSQGYGPDYERPNTDPSYKPIGRQEWNGLMYDVTSALGEIQKTGAAAWDAGAAPYALDAMVYHDGGMWVSIVANNSATPGGGIEWARLMGLATTEAPGRIELATQAETLAGADLAKAVTPSTLGQLRPQVIPFVQGGGTANAMTAEFSPVVSSLANGATVYVRAAATNTGLTTLDVNSLGALPIVGLGGQPLVGGEIVANGIAKFVYSAAASSWILVFCVGGAQQIGGARVWGDVAVGRATARVPVDINRTASTYATSISTTISNATTLLKPIGADDHLIAMGAASDGSQSGGYIQYVSGDGLQSGTLAINPFGSGSGMSVGKISGSLSVPGLYLAQSGFIRMTRNEGTTLIEMNRLDGDGDMVRFFSSSSLVGSISVASGSTSYNTTSDYRLKENVEELSGSLDRIAASKIYKYNFKSSPGTVYHGCLAHELSVLFPHAVMGEKDAVEDIGNIVDEDGNIVDSRVTCDDEIPSGCKWVKTGERIKAQEVDYSKIVPDLMGAIQELDGMVKSLKAEVEFLKGTGSGD